ncbi:mitochondrial calcium uniporter regulator 1-like [Cyrtonyx montezumae]|uniref:mitochondrial calcium uniporter regulator 1-like n=1 Tax=Cyrtonyx montezumae TaxID=9017 RepID=UPI0032D9C8A6
MLVGVRVLEKDEPRRLINVHIKNKVHFRGTLLEDLKDRGNVKNLKNHSGAGGLCSSPAVPPGAGGLAVRRALLVLRSRGALPPASASPTRRGLSACPREGAAVSVGSVWARRVGRARRCGESGVSDSASSFLQSKGSVSLLGSRKFFFDTHALVRLLEENGLTTQQSEVIVSALVKIVSTNLDTIYKDMVTKVQQVSSKRIALQQVMSHIDGVKKDMIILGKSELSALRSENERIKLELQQIKKQVMDEITRVRADNKLNLNLEKSRVKELHSLNERKLLEMRTEIVELHAQQDRALTQTGRKIASIGLEL